MQSSDLRRQQGTRAPGDGGFTLVELVIFAAIMLLLILGCLGMMSGATKSSAVTYEIGKLEDAARESLSTMTRQLRVATVIDASSTNSSLTLQGDLDGNGVKESVTFNVAGGVLCKTVPGFAAEEWVSNVDRVTFTYYEPGAGDVVVTPGSSGWNTRVGRVSIIIELSADAMGARAERTYEASVAMRNTM